MHLINNYSRGNAAVAKGLDLAFASPADVIGCFSSARNPVKSPSPCSRACRHSIASMRASNHRVASFGASIHVIWAPDVVIYVSPAADGQLLGRGTP